MTSSIRSCPAEPTSSDASNHKGAVSSIDASQDNESRLRRRKSSGSTNEGDRTSAWPTADKGRKSKQERMIRSADAGGQDQVV